MNLDDEFRKAVLYFRDEAQKQRESINDDALANIIRYEETRCYQSEIRNLYVKLNTQAYFYRMQIIERYRKCLSNDK